MALPETFLGLVPGWGGCYLLPNLVGPANALKVIIENPMNMNRMLKGPQAFELGMADAMFEPADFLEQSLLWAGRVLTGETKVERPEISRDESEWAGAVKAAKALVDLKTGGRSPAPYRALQLVAAARTAGRDEAFAAEDEVLADLVMGDELRAGLYSFDLVQRRAKRPAGAPDKALARPVTKVGIVGAGLMASQLALLFAQRLEVPVVMTDLDEGRVAKGVGYVHGEVDKLLAKGRVGPDKANRLKALVTGSTSKDGFADADFVIEAVFEEMSVKKTVWAEVEAIVSPDCVLATNTSSLSITEMAADLKNPERVVGFHFFNPVAVMPLLEIIKGESTDEPLSQRLSPQARRCGRRRSWSRTPPPSSSTASSAASWARSPGLSTRAPRSRSRTGRSRAWPRCRRSCCSAWWDRRSRCTTTRPWPRPSPTASTSRTTCAGSSRRRSRRSTSWPEGKPVVDPEVEALFEKPADPVVLTTEQVRERVLGVLADEARRMLDEGVAQAPMDLDLAMITGAGFQFWNGGLTPLLDREGLSEKVTGQRFLPPGVASVPV